MNIKISHMINYISDLVKKYGEIQQIQMQNTFRIASIKSTTTETKVIFQVIGKATFMECTPAEILSNDAFIERFSKKDVQKITYAHAKDENLKASRQTSPDLQLVRQEFNMSDGKTSFILKDKDGNTSLKTAKEIVLDKIIIKKLDQQEALNIGYVAGYEHSQNDSNN